MSEQRPRVAIKFGTETVIDKKTGQVDAERIDSHTERIARVHDIFDVMVISSGARGAGDDRLRAMGHDPLDVDDRLRAFLGTASISNYWEQSFQRRGVAAGQVLMTYDEMKAAREGPRFRGAMNAAFAKRFLPILNYKDFLSMPTDPDDEISKIDAYKDNDHFAREVAVINEADAIIYAIDGAEGFMDGRDRVVHHFYSHMLAGMRAEDYRKSEATTGGIVSKLTEGVEARIAGLNTYLCSADADFARVLAGEPIGTEVLQ